MDPDKLSGCSTKNNVLRLSSDNKNLLTAMHMHKHCQQRRKNIKENKDKIQNTKSGFLLITDQISVSQYFPADHLLQQDALSA